MTRPQEPNAPARPAVANNTGSPTLVFPIPFGGVRDRLAHDTGYLFMLAALRRLAQLEGAK